MKPILEAIENTPRNNLRLEDVFISGLVRQQAKIPIYDLPPIGEHHKYLMPYF